MILDFKNYYLAGVGGAGMSALASLLLEAGKNVAGSDIEQSYKTEKLSKKGVQIQLTQDKLPESFNAECFIHTAAISPDNPQLKEAKSKNIPALKYTQFLGEMSKQFKTIAVCGTHGKTTTTALISFILENAGLNPCYVIGEEIINTNRASRFGQGLYMVVESCEFGKNFYDIQPAHIVLTNIEEEHPDTFHNLSEVTETFSTFLEKCRGKDSRIFINSGDKNCCEIIKQKNLPYEKISGVHGEEWSVAKSNGHMEIFRCDSLFGKYQPFIKGRHNLTNMLLAVACSSYLGIPNDIIEQSLREFKGTRRRLELIKETDSYKVYDDYAHHPTQVHAVLQTVRELYPNSKIIAVFQGHQYKRTERFFKEYTESFDNADMVIVTPIYFARDKSADTNLPVKLSAEIAKRVKESVYTGSFEKAKELVHENIKPQTIIVTLGAGTIYKLAHEL
ncbi:MAG: UDP-N-acetylmuramate--L-alanine ligase [Planctomycetes bacterium]|nr:UDP-N-acetylmuramate--L-alanine ligase [Planctomycetota bacterium]